MRTDEQQCLSMNTVVGCAKSSRNNKIRNKSSKKFDGQTSSVSIDHSSLHSYGVTDFVKEL